MEESEEDLCSICYEDINNGSKINTLKCGHKYHYKCIKDWYFVNATCPDCRGKIPNRPRSNLLICKGTLQNGQPCRYKPVVGRDGYCRIHRKLDNPWKIRCKGMLANGNKCQYAPSPNNNGYCKIHSVTLSNENQKIPKKRIKFKFIKLTSPTTKIS